MGNLLKLVGLIIGTAVCLAVFTSYEPDTLDAQTKILGYPVISIGHTDAEGIIAFGQVARGVLVIAQGGIGIITFAQGGVGLIFGIGQLMFGLLAIAQVGIGLFFFLGQGGGGIQALGQGVFGKSVSSYVKEMNAEINELLAWRRAV